MLSLTVCILLVLYSGFRTFSHDFAPFTREFGPFTRKLRPFTREFGLFTREFCCFTREFTLFTREFVLYPCFRLSPGGSRFLKSNEFFQEITAGKLAFLQVILQSSAIPKGLCHNCLRLRFF
jgi:hypothetical protein